MPLRAMTAISDVPPPISITMRARRLLDRQTDADRRGHRFLNQVDFARAGVFGGVTHRALLHLGDARRDGDDDAWFHQDIYV